MLAATDATVVPSLYEPFGMVALEAAAAGAPLAVAATGGLAEIVEPGVTGVTFPHSDPAALAGAVGSLLADEVVRPPGGPRGAERWSASGTAGPRSPPGRRGGYRHGGAADPAIPADVTGQEPDSRPTIVVPEGNLLAGVSLTFPFPAILHFRTRSAEPSVARKCKVAALVAQIALAFDQLHDLYCWPVDSWGHSVDGGRGDPGQRLGGAGWSCAHGRAEEGTSDEPLEPDIPDETTVSGDADMDDAETGDADGDAGAGEPAPPPDLWAAVVDRLDPALATPTLRPGIERADLVSVRDIPYTMLRSPDGAGRHRCGPVLPAAHPRRGRADRADGRHPHRRPGWSPSSPGSAGGWRPTRSPGVVADLAANRMLEELPVDAFGPLRRAAGTRGPVAGRWRSARCSPSRAAGRMVVADADPLMSALYRFGGRWLFTPVAAGITGFLAVAGLVLFGWTWWQGSESVFLADGSYWSAARPR